VVWKIALSPFLWFTVLLIAKWAFARFRRRALAADGSAFIVIASAADITTAAIWLCGLIAAAAQMFGHEPSPPQSVHFLALSATGLCLILGLWVWWRPTILSLTPGGVRVRTPLRTRWFPWDEMVEPVTSKGLIVDLGGRRKKVAAGQLTAETSFLAQAIEFYRQNPEHRPAIGTPEEHRRWA
jgi:hypothetical protein